MKLTKKLSALLMAMVMLVALCACGDLTNEDLNGEWTLTATPSTMEMDQIIPIAGFEYNEKLVLKAVFKDGTLDLYTDGIITWAKGMADKLYQWIEEGDNIYSFFATANEMTVTAYKEECADMGTTKEQLINMFTAELSKEQLIKSFTDSFGSAKTITHSYTIDGNRLIFDEGAIWSLEVDDNRIAITEIEKDDALLTIEKDSMVFSR